MSGHSAAAGRGKPDARTETSGGLLAFALQSLGGGASSARLDAEVLLAYALNSTRARLHGWPNDSVTSEQAARYRNLIARRAGGEPVAYLTGTREFWSLSLEVTTHTLIPRPQTERLVEVVLGLIPAHSTLTVADLGTGSGAVAAAIASERPACQVIATDVCRRALAVAAGNVARLGLDNVSLRQGRWYRALGAQRCALIASNPPYVASGDAHLSRGDVRFEPRLALSAGDDGLDAIRHIVAGAQAHLLPDAALVVEHGHEQSDAVQELFHRHGYQNIEAYLDLEGHARVVSGRCR
jgi:release factor glutamine methyltransferase